MPQRSISPLKFFFIWAIANVLGISCAAVVMPWLFASLVKSINSIVVSIFIFAVPISLAQWLALRRICHTSILWILTVPVGILILRLIPEGFGQIFDDESIASLTASYLVIGFTIGFLQWLVLRGQFSGSSIWILGSTAGVGLSFWFILATDLINRSGFISLVLGVVVYIVITGTILIRLITRKDRASAGTASPT